MPGRARRKGQPVWVLTVILGGWVGLRVATWDVADRDAFEDALNDMMAGAFGHAAGPARATALAGNGPAHLPVAPRMEARRPLIGPGLGFDPGLLPPIRPSTLHDEVPLRPTAHLDMAQAMAGGGHELLWMAAVAQMPLLIGVTSGSNAAGAARLEQAAAPTLAPPRAAPMLEPPSAPTGLADHSASALPRWSGDGWLLARQGGGGAAGGTLLLPSYGANQVGAVLRYHLAPTSPFRPAVYGRAYAALNGTGEREAALGLSARPLPGVPLVAMAEGRFSHFAGGSTHLRPAVTVVTALPPVVLPLAMRAETYVQGGYVGGAAATPFVDGQFRLEHIADHRARSEVRLGGGIWGGAQQGAARLDVGPGATLAFTTGRAGAHLSVDWRFRVAGRAMPASGPAVTLAAGF